MIEGVMQSVLHYTPVALNEPTNYEGGPVPHEFPEGFESLSERVSALKRERDAVVLAHYYVPAEVQALADYVGDSFYLARLACTLEARVIVLCGVSFMGQSVKLLNPSRTVLAPEPLADCPMAHMVRRQDVDMAHDRDRKSVV